MKLNLPHERLFEQRRQVLSQLDRLNRRMDVDGQLNAMDELQEQAYELLLGGGVSRALDLSLEDPRTVQRYDTSHYVQAKAWNHVSRGRSGYYTAQAKTIGKLLLLARRLCEAGCGFVTIHAGYAGVWDMHADGNNLNVTDGMAAVGRSLDHAVAAFVEDVEARGLDDKIMPPPRSAAPTVAPPPPARANRSSTRSQPHNPPAPRPPSAGAAAPPRPGRQRSR